MTDRIRKTLGDLKARQDAGEQMLCPRCGRNTMKKNIHTNALSRYADIYICDACGTEEAPLKFIRAAVGHLFFDHIGTVSDVFHVDFLLQLRQLRGSRCAFMSASIRK